MWPPSSGRIGNRLIRPSERLTSGQQEQRRGDPKSTPGGDVAGADDARDLLAFLGVEDMREDVDGPRGDHPHRSTRLAAAPASARDRRVGCRRRSRPAARSPASYRAGPRSFAPRRRIHLHHGVAATAPHLGAGALVRPDLLAEASASFAADAGGVAVDRNELVARLQHLAAGHLGMTDADRLVRPAGRRQETPKRTRRPARCSRPGPAPITTIRFQTAAVVGAVPDLRGAPPPASSR